MKNKKVVLIGSLAVLLAVALILVAIFLPMARGKSGMKKILQSVSDAARVSLGDPDFNTGDVLGNNGKEILLEGDALASVQAEISALAESGYRYGGDEKGFAGKLDLNLKIRTAEDEIFYLWFAEGRFYYTENGRCIYFEPKDEGAYAALYANLNALLQ